MSSRVYRIGDWTFHAPDNELRRGEERRRLEDRAARTLELLCEGGGSTISRDDIVRRVWNGRSQSPNSLPVVIGDLRRALEDDARNPRFIETVAKRGYRLIAAGPVERQAEPARKSGLLPLLLGLLAVIGLFAAWGLSQGDDDGLAFVEVVNASGDPGNDSLARATSELIAADLSRRGITFTRSAADAKGTVLGARLVDWNGEPTVALSATEADGGTVWWSSMARGPAEAIPGNVTRALGDFSAAWKRRGS